jgi:dipeptide transport system permease protein
MDLSRDTRWGPTVWGDVMSRMMYGGRVALSVAMIAGTLTCVLGSGLGLITGYFWGWPDIIISRLVDIWMAFPPVLFAILLIAVLSTGLTSIIIAVVVIDWTRFARVIRAKSIGQGAMDYVASAQVVGHKRFGIMVQEILPNVLPTICVLLTLEMSIAVIVEAILSFVNLSISTDQPT